MWINLHKKNNMYTESVADFAGNDDYSLDDSFDDIFKESGKLQWDNFSPADSALLPLKKKINKTTSSITTLLYDIKEIKETLQKTVDSPEFLELSAVDYFKTVYFLNKEAVETFYPHIDEIQICIKKEIKSALNLIKQSWVDDGFIEKNKDIINSSINEFLKSDHKSIISLLTLELRSPEMWLNSHSLMVAIASLRIAILLWWDKNRLPDVFRTALLHDVWKIWIPKKILEEKWWLTKKERTIINRHSLAWYTMLIHDPASALVAAQHHYNPDKEWMPKMIEGEEESEEYKEAKEITELFPEFQDKKIGTMSEINKIADIEVALREHRCYRKKHNETQNDREPWEIIAIMDNLARIWLIDKYIYWIRRKNILEDARLNNKTLFLEGSVIEATNIILEKCPVKWKLNEEKMKDKTEDEKKKLKDLLLELKKNLLDRSQKNSWLEVIEVNWNIVQLQLKSQLLSKEDSELVKYLWDAANETFYYDIVQDPNLELAA